MFAEHTTALHSACVHVYTHIIHTLYTHYTHIIHTLYTHYTHIIHTLHGCVDTPVASAYTTILPLLSVLSDTCQLSLGSSNPCILQTLQIHYRSQTIRLYVALVSAD